MNLSPLTNTAAKGISFLLFSLLFLLVAESVLAEEKQFLRNHIEQIERQSDYTIGGELFVAHHLLHTIYRNNQFQLLWQKPESVAQLLDAIQTSVLDGLTPDDYHLQALLRLREKKAAGMEYHTLAVNFDLLLTDALIRLAYDKRFGKVDPKHLHPEWNLPEKTLLRDPATTIENAVTDGTVGRALASLTPPSLIYHHLKQALAKYRRIAEQGGWDVVSSGPAMKLGMQGGRVQALRDRLFRTGELAGEDRALPVFDKGLQQAVVRFQQRHHLDADGVVGRQTLAELNTPVKEKINQIRVNLERARWILHDVPETVILVDIAGYGLRYYHKGELVWQTKVVVGQPYHMTPTFESAITYLVINPTWTIPRSIITRETLPKLQKNPGYLQEHNLRILDYKKNSIDPATVDWQRYSGKTFPYLIRQDPGPHNSLGRIKFMFPNKYAIYLHDTPHRDLFSKNRRAFSHGCIRVYKPLLLGEQILKNDGQDWDLERIARVVEGAKITTVKLNASIPIMLLYWTVDAESDRGIVFKQDIYGRDEKLLQALDGPFRIRKSVARQMKLYSYQKRTRPVSR